MLSMYVMDIMNALCTGMNMSISNIHVWLCNIDIFTQDKLDYEITFKNTGCKIYLGGVLKA